MKAAEEFYEEQKEEKDITPFLDLSDNKLHTLKVKEAKRGTNTYEGNERKGVWYLVEEDGEEKKWFSNAFVVTQVMAKIESGDKVKVKRYREKVGTKDNGDPEYRTRHKIEKVGEKDEIPVVEENESSEEVSKREEQAPRF